MPQSMTGIGIGRASDAGWRATVELRSVNHRHLDLRFRHGAHGSAVQQAISTAIKARLERGHIAVRVDIERDQGSQPVARVDRPLAEAFKAAAEQLSDVVGGDTSVDVAWLAGLSGVVELEQPDEASEAIAALVGEAVAAAIDELLRVRRTEGDHLAADLIARTRRLQSLQAEIALLAADLVPARRLKLRERLSDVAAELGSQVDTGRLEQELVLYAERIDITEELVRLEGHLLAFVATLQQDQPGRRLGFLVQELLREVNTIGSKANSLPVTEHVITAKVEIERLREQVLNLA